MIGFGSGHKRGQALVELAAWGGLMLIGASILVSYMMNLIYTQDTMMRNFRMAVNFARQVGAKNTDATVIHELIVHRRIPSLPFLPDSGYREFRHISQVRFTRNMFASESDSDPTYPLILVRIVIDGRILAEEMGIESKRFSYIYDWLPNALRSQSDLLRQVFFTDLPILDMIYGSIEGIIDGAKKIIDDPGDFMCGGLSCNYGGRSRRQAKRDLKNAAEQVKVAAEDYKTFLDGLIGNYRDQDSNTRQQIKTKIAQVISLAVNVINLPYFYDKNEVFTKPVEEIMDERDLLNTGHWKGDVAKDYWGKTVIESMKGEIKIGKDNTGGKIEVLNPYLQRRKIRSSYGNNEIEWVAPNEEISW